MTVRSAISEFLAALTAERGLSKNTVSAYRRDLVQYQDFLDTRGVHTPDAETVSRFVGTLSDAGLATSTVARKVAAVRGLHRFMIAEGMTETDPTASLATPRRAESLPKALTVDEVGRLLDAPDRTTIRGSRDAAMLELLYASGCRVSEAVAVKVSDIDFEMQEALVTGKGDKQRLVPLGSYAIKALRAYLPARLELKGDRPDPDWLFLNARGGRISRQAVWQVVREHGRAAGLDPGTLSPHVLRHSAATHMVEGGADLRTVQQILGHASISTTQTYTKVSPQHLYEVYVVSHPRR